MSGYGMFCTLVYMRKVNQSVHSFVIAIKPLFFFLLINTLQQYPDLPILIYYIYPTLSSQVAESIERQTQLEQRLEPAYSRFQQETQQHGSTARDTMLKDLAAAFDAYQELSSNLEEGTQFYNNLTPLLVKMQSKVSDFVFARTTEKDDLLK